MKRGESISVLLKRAAVSAIGVLIGSSLVPGISYEDNGTLALVVLLLGLFSSFLKPLLVLFALPFVVLTLGLGVLLINALLYMLVGHLVESFYVADFWAAFFGALIISLLNLIFSPWIRGRPAVRVSGHRSGRGSPQRPAKPSLKDDDVIDI